MFEVPKKKLKPIWRGVKNHPSLSHLSKWSVESAVWHMEYGVLSGWHDMQEMTDLEFVGCVCGTKCVICHNPTCGKGLYGRRRHSWTLDEWEMIKTDKIDKFFRPDCEFVGPSLCRYCHSSADRFSKRKSQNGERLSNSILLWMTMIAVGKHPHMVRRLVGDELRAH